MHWFDSQLQVLYQLAEAYQKCRNNSFDDAEETRKTRTEFINSVQELVDSVVKLSDISGCVAGHDGFILAKAGSIVDSDALGVMLQESMLIAERSNKLLALGKIQQILIVGEKNKIAMISIGQLTLGIVSSKHINLADTLSQDPN